MLPDKKNYTFDEVLAIFEIPKDSVPDIRKPRKSLEELEEVVKELKLVFKVAYRKAALKYHPDHGGNAHDFKVINSLYHFIIKSIKIRRLPAQPPTAFQFIRPVYTFYRYTGGTTSTSTSTSYF